MQCNAFLNEVKPYIAQIGRSNVYNSDQSGFNLELHSGRTLAKRGTKIVEAGVQWLSSLLYYSANRFYRWALARTIIYCTQEQYRIL